MLDSSKYPGGQLLETVTWLGIFEPQVIVPKDEFYPTIYLTHPKWTTYGLAWFQHDYAGRNIDFHTGSLGGTIAQIGLIREEKLGYYFLGNLDHAEVRHALMYQVFDAFGPEGTGRDWSREMMALYHPNGLDFKGIGDFARDDPGKVQGPDHPLADYAGLYEHPVWGQIDIIADVEGLYFIRPHLLRNRLKHKDREVFVFDIQDYSNPLAVAFSQDLVFESDAQGEVIALRWDLLGYRFEKVE